MWKLIFDNATKRGTGCNREPLEGEFSKDLQPSECAWFNVQPERYWWNGLGIEEMDKAVLDAEKLTTAKARLKQDNRAKCQTHILATYPLPVQSSAWGGVYPSEVADSIRKFIAGCIGEENRVADLIDLVTDMKELEAVGKPAFPQEGV